MTELPCQSPSLRPARRTSAPLAWTTSPLIPLMVTLLASPDAPAAELVERVERVAMAVPAPDGHTERREIVVTVVREDRAGHHPFIVLEHGRGVDAPARAAIGMQAYPANARYFAALGFVVVVPTRIGYGISGGPDVEYTGDCGSKRYAPGIGAALAETRQLLDHVATLPHVDRTRGVILGESFGGLLAIAAASLDLPGVRAAVNFAGGDGGDSLRHVDQPCQPDRLRAAFAAYGATSRVPTLWLYSRNDRVWGAEYPKGWFAAFRAAGGRGEFVELAADKNNGHYIFNRNPPAWQPAVERFLAQNGFAAEIPPRR